MPSSPVSEERAAGAGRRPPERRTARRRARAAGAELAQLEDRYKRALADLDNYRKRAAREVERRVGEAREALLRDWLEAVDSVERALRHGAPENPLVRRACAPCSTRWRRSSPARASRASARAGEPFDPERHEAVGVARDRRGAGPHGRRRRAVGLRARRPGAAPGAGRRRPRARRSERVMAVAFRDYYEALGVPRDASDEDIRARLPHAGAQVPPRRQQGAGRRGPLQGDLRGLRGPARPREARALRPPRRRTGGPARTCPARPGSRASTGGGGGGGDRDVRVDFGDFGGGDFSDFFEGLFGGAARRRGGGAAGSTASPCAAATRRPCSSSRSRRPRAAGRRRISLGDGRDFEVDIPPGVRDGQRIRLAGEGGSGSGGGPPGDLLPARARSGPHPRFRRRGPRPVHGPPGRPVGGGARRARSRCRRSTAARG